ncbi:MAG: Alcohol dehydrogenase GroES domain protein [Amycolatopsis sp.]|uniref:NADP-dependent oxidoreductase n=1 Tax=Amycolatopsis sp. TaxID=37632 RepID=UPI00262AEB73|nr:NADP-dependent oxidoreductase [Amycolatopsis sp.]MCU1681726.1 Alcohol dehydrogenase GroES domain protein [Amycolatopsis sp.]
MPQAVRYTEHGDIDVLQVVDVERPVPGPGQVLVQVKAAGINPGEVAIRIGTFASRWPSTFPSGQGSDLAGVVVELGEGVEGRKIGDEVIGWVDTRSSQAEFAVVDAENLTERPSNVPWEVAGGLFVAGTTAYAAVQAVRVREGDVVVVSGAAGGVGSIVVQLAKDAGATVIGIASESNHAWLTGHGVIPVAYGDGVADRIKAAGNGKVDAFIDTFGSGYVKLALDLGIPADRINTIIDFEAVEKYGVKVDGNAKGATAEILSELAALVSKGSLEIPVAKVYPLAEVKAAFRDLEQRHTRGKIVLKP